MGQRYILHKLFKIEAHELTFKKHCNINNVLAFLWLLFFFFFELQVFSVFTTFGKIRLCGLSQPPPEISFL